MHIEEMLTSSKEDKGIKQISYEMFKLNLQFKEQEIAYKQKKAELQGKIQKYLQKKDQKSFGFGIGNSTYKVQNVEQKKIIWDIDELKRKLSSDILNKILIKEVKVVDLVGLMKYLKSCGVDSKEFKKYISVSTTVNEKQVNQLSEMGEIDESDLNGCYVVKPISSYVRIDVEENEPEEE